MKENNALDFFKGDSKFQEIFAEYTFLSDLMLAAASNQEKILISRSDFDAFGFDVLVGSLSREKVLHIQFKASSGSTYEWDIHKTLLQNKDGRVIIIRLVLVDEKIELNYYRLKSGNRERICKRKPIVRHQGKCRIRDVDFEPISKEILLSIFDY